MAPLVDDHARIGRLPSHHAMDDSPIERVRTLAGIDRTSQKLSVVRIWAVSWNERRCVIRALLKLA